MKPGDLYKHKRYPDALYLIIADCDDASVKLKVVCLTGAPSSRLVFPCACTDKWPEGERGFEPTGINIADVLKNIGELLK